jgi:hypothetical protein
MGLLRGKKKAGQSTGAENEIDGITEFDDADAVDRIDEGSGTPEVADLRRPMDESEADPDDSTMPRLNLGSMWVPVFSDMEVRVELNEARQPVAATLLHAGSTVQLLAFAAPRNDGIWDDVRAEIAESIRADGGKAEEAEGPFGTELRVRARAQVQPGEVTEQPLRFVGFDGPRWFVRGVFSGPAATNPQQAAPLEAVITRVVISRGEEPMAPRDPLPLRLPTDVIGMPQPPEEEKPNANPLERGPEITETR